MVTQLMGLGCVGVVLTFVTRRGHSNRGFNYIFLHVFICPVFKASARGFPFACCRHSFTSGNWSSRLLPSTSALCGSILANTNLQSLLLENLSLGNLDWLSGIWGFCQRPVASTDCCCAGAAKPPKEAANDPLYGARPRSSNKDPARHIAILSTSSRAMNVVTFTSTMPAFCQERNKAPGAAFFWAAAWGRQK